MQNIYLIQQIKDENHHIVWVKKVRWRNQPTTCSGNFTLRFVNQTHITMVDEVISIQFIGALRNDATGHEETR